MGVTPEPSSVAVTVTTTVPFTSAWGLNERVCVPPPSKTTGAGRIASLSLDVLMTTVCVASSAPPPAVSPVIETSVSAASSSMDTSAIASNAGASFTALTVIVNVCTDVLSFGADEAPSSVAVSVMTAVPFASVTGVKETTPPVIVGFETTDGLSLTAVNVTV